MERPSSAPGYHPNSQDLVDKDGIDSIREEFRSMEERIEGAMGKENRGHKLPLQDLPYKRPRVLRSRLLSVDLPDEHDFDVLFQSSTSMVCLF